MKRSPIKRGKGIKKKVAKKKPKKRKLLTIPKLKEKVCTHIKRYIKLRDSVFDGEVRWAKCVTCDTLVQVGTAGCQGGHFQHGKGKATWLIEDNIHVQCVRCNKHLHGNLVKYTIWMQKEYGTERVDELIRLHDEPSNLKRYELDEMLVHYKKKLEELTE